MVYLLSVEIYKRKTKIILGSTIVFILLISLFGNIPFVSCAWLPSGWIYRKYIEITGSAGAGTNYQINVTVHSGSGSDGGYSVYLGGNCTDFPNDITFTDDDETTVLDHWGITINGTAELFWIEVVDSLSVGTTDIYIYYGKEGQSSTDSGEDTFQFFDDFSGDLSKWTVLQGAFSIDAGRLKAGVPNPNNIIRSDVSVSRGFVLELEQYMGGVAARGQGLIWYVQDVDNFYTTYLWDTPNTIEAYKKEGGGEGSIGSVGVGVVNPNVWYNIKIASKVDDTFDSYLDDAKKHSDVSDTVWDSGYIGCRNYEANMYWDDIRVRKYIEAEPTITGFGAAESNVGDPPINISCVIIPLETDNSVYAMERWYIFQANISDVDNDIANVSISITDNTTLLNFTHVVSGNLWNRTNGYSIGELNSSSCSNSTSGIYLIVNFSVRIKYGIDEIEDVDIYILSSDDMVNNDGWEIINADYFNITKRSIGESGLSASPIFASFFIVMLIGISIVVLVIGRKML